MDTGYHSNHDHGTHEQGKQSTNPHAHTKEAAKGHAEHGAHGMHDKHAGHHTADFLKRFWICLAVTIPLLLLSHMIQQWLGFELRFNGDRYILLALGTFIYLYGGMPFLKGMIAEIKYRAIGMMTLVALAITVAFVYSVAVIFGLDGMDFFWELATLVDIMLLGHWLEMRSQMAASRALESLVRLLPAEVHVEKENGVVDIPINELKKEDLMLVKPGEKIAADGIVIEGSTNVNESMLTGESIPVKKGSGDKLIGGSINGDGSVKVRVTATGAESYLNKVINMVESAQSAKSTTQNLADKVAKWLTIISITIGIATFIYWFQSSNDLSFALERMVTVMVTSCPHALGVAIPLVAAISTSLSATNGLLIRNRTAFENTGKLSTIIFDKTGTLTKGSHEVQQVIALNNSMNEEEIIKIAAAVQQNSEHHIAHGIMNRFRSMNAPLYAVNEFHYIQGVGVGGTVNEDKILSVGPNYFSKHQLPLPSIPGSIDQETETITFLLKNDQPVGIITLADTIRENSAAAIAELKKINIRSYLLTGDNEKIAGAVAAKLQMDGFMANVLPGEKQEKVKEFQRKGETVAMTGDGVNDAPALAQADIGIAIGSGTDVAAETADIILVNSDPRDVVHMIRFGKATYRKMVENLIWAVGYNVIAIPLAAGVLYPHFVLSPAMGAILMSLSTIIVAMNAQLLRRKFQE